MQFHLACLVRNVHKKNKPFHIYPKKKLRSLFKSKIQVKTFKCTVNGAHTFPKEKNIGGLKKKKNGGAGVGAEEPWSWKNLL